MIVCKKLRFAFVHIPKTGGSSMTLLLAPYVNAEAKTVAAGWQHGFHSDALMHQPITPQTLKASRKLFKFAFVRNPWGWLASMYHSKAAKATKYGYGYKGDLSWEEFVEAVADGTVNLPAQSWWLSVNGRVAMDHVARFERFAEECCYIMGRLGLPMPDEVPHRVRRKEKRRYTDLYDARLRDLVAKVFAEDIERWGYEYGP